MSSKRFAGIRSLFLCLPWAAVSLAAEPFPAVPPWQPDPAQREHLRRSLTLLQSSVPTNRKTVRVLFYGQSITEQAWWKEVERYLRATYPNADLIIENRALGGHAAQLLVKTAEADLYPFQPDLLIFHVYGSHLEYENLIRRVRERTCADILLQTDHITSDASMIEETDASKLTPKQWDAWMNHAFLPQTAEKYGACRADIHELWKVYLRTNHLKASALLKDGVHLNGHGEWLMAEFIKSYLAPLPSKPNYDPMNEARARTVPPAASLGHNVATYGFDGMRVDLIFGPGTHGALEVMIDGKRPSAIPELYVFTRVSPFPSSNWPILLKAGSVSPLLKEEWSLRIGHATEDGKNCHFELAGAITGDDGEGWSTNRFVSNSRRVVIEPDDWNLAYCAAVFKHPIPEPFVATWRAVLLGTDWATPPEVKDGVERCLTLAQGLPPGRHTLELRGPNVDQSVRAVRAYRPPACAYPQGQ